MKQVEKLSFSENEHTKTLPLNARGEWTPQNGLGRRLFQSLRDTTKRNYFDSISFFQLSALTFTSRKFFKKNFKKNT